MMESNPSLAGMLLVLFGVLGALVSILVLRAINRKFNVFTRGTVSFILFVLIVFTCVDTVQILNGVRNTETSTRFEASRQTVSSVLCNWLDKSRTDAIHQIDLESDRDQIDLDLQDIESMFVRELANSNAPIEKFAELKLVSLNVGNRVRHYNTAFSGNRHYQFQAFLDDGKLIHELAGEVGINDHNSQFIRLVDVKAKKRREWHREAASHELVYGFHRAKTFQSDDYEVDLNRLTLVHQPQAGH